MFSGLKRFYTVNVTFITATCTIKLDNSISLSIDNDEEYIIIILLNLQS